MNSNEEEKKGEKGGFVFGKRRENEASILSNGFLGEKRRKAARKRARSPLHALLCVRDSECVDDETLK